MRSAFAILVASLASAQLTAQPTSDDYARAERFLLGNTSRLVSGLVASPIWVGSDRLVYRVSRAEGNEFMRIEARSGSRAPAFDHEAMARALSDASGETLKPYGLPTRTVRVEAEGTRFVFGIEDREFRCTVDPPSCREIDEETREFERNSIVSPDGSMAAFIKDHNLWVRDLASGADTALTTDGVEDYGYATNNAGWLKSDAPVLLWSPDSRKIATFQHDGREVGMMYLVSTRVGHPELSAWRYPLPGDPSIFTLRRVILDVPSRTTVPLSMDPDPHRSTISDHVAERDGTWLDVEWSEDASQLAFVSSSRDHKVATLRLADATSGDVRTITEESTESFFESGNDKVNWHLLAGSNEVIWFSEQDDWGHLYLHDLETGALKYRITSGDWNVLQVRHIDHASRTLYFTGSCREPGDPYFEYLYRVKLDGSGLELLTPEPAHHVVTMSPSGEYVLDSYSTPTTPPVTVLRKHDGRVLLELERGDASRLLEAGWRPPEPFVVKARDGRTDLHGLMYKPTRFDESKKYPVLNYVYPGPQSGSVGSRAFSPSRSDKQSGAELGFIVVELDATGTPGRSKSFHAAYYGNMGDNGIPAQIAGIRELASRHPWMDLDRVGIWGHSGGGFASTRAILAYPDFYEVAVSSAGNHDNRNYEDDWAEKWQGLLEQTSETTTNYDNQANQLLAKNLKGKLLLAHGTLDTNVPPSNTLLVVDALIVANKDFDLLMFPNRPHGFGNEPYMMRRRWDYFVRHLLGVEPPKEYEIKPESIRP